MIVDILETVRKAIATALETGKPIAIRMEDGGAEPVLALLRIAVAASTGEGKPAYWGPSPGITAFVGYVDGVKWGVVVVDHETAADVTKGGYQ